MLSIHHQILCYTIVWMILFISESLHLVPNLPQKQSCTDAFNIGCYIDSSHELSCVRITTNTTLVMPNVSCTVTRYQAGSFDVKLGEPNKLFRSYHKTALDVFFADTKGSTLKRLELSFAEMSPCIFWNIRHDLDIKFVCPADYLVKQTAELEFNFHHDNSFSISLEMCSNTILCSKCSFRVPNVNLINTPTLDDFVYVKLVKFSRQNANQKLGKCLENCQLQSFNLCQGRNNSDSLFLTSSTSKHISTYFRPHNTTPITVQPSKVNLTSSTTIYDSSLSSDDTMSKYFITMQSVNDKPQIAFQSYIDNARFGTLMELLKDFKTTDRHLLLFLIMFAFMNLLLTLALLCLMLRLMKCMGYCRRRKGVYIIGKDKLPMSPAYSESILM